MKFLDFINNFQYNGNGVGKNTLIKDVNKQQLIVGIAVELEHTDDLNISASISIDHLTENENYYTILIESGLVDEKKALQLANIFLNYYSEKEDPHASAQFGASSDAGENTDDKEMTDVLLGYKPHNVGDDDIQEDIIGAGGATSVVGTNNPTDDDADVETANNLKKYQDYENKDFDTLSNNDKEEYFNLWSKFKNKK